MGCVSGLNVYPTKNIFLPLRWANFIGHLTSLDLRHGSQWNYRMSQFRSFERWPWICQEWCRHDIKIVSHHIHAKWQLLFFVFPRMFNKVRKSFFWLSKRLKLRLNNKNSPKLQFNENIIIFQEFKNFFFIVIHYFDFNFYIFLSFEFDLLITIFLPYFFPFLFPFIPTFLFVIF